MIKYTKVWVNGMTARLDFAIAYSHRLFSLSFFGRDSETIKAINAALMTGKTVTLKSDDGRTFDVFPYGAFKCKIARLENGNDPFYHSVAVRVKGDDKEQVPFLSSEERVRDDFFSYLMENYPFPLIREWKDKLWEIASSQSRYAVTYRHSESDRYPLVLSRMGDTIYMDGQEVDARDLILVAPQPMIGAPNGLMEDVKQAFQRGELRLSDSPLPITAETIDEYVDVYGDELIRPLQEQLAPLTPLNGEVSNFTTNSKVLYPQQIAMVNAVVNLLYGGQGNKRERKKLSSKYAILNEGMGSGKTLQAACMCEAYVVQKELQNIKTQLSPEEAEKTLADIYKDEGRINYRNIVMCPGHLVEKWAREIEEQVPYAKVTIVDSLASLIALKARGPERKGREFYILGKDFAKLSYQEKPVPKTIKRDYFYDRYCNTCNRRVLDTKCPQCGGTDWHFKKTDIQLRGLACPGCGKVLIPNKAVKMSDLSALTPVSFTEQKDSNQICLYCGTRLWEPHVRNINTSGVENPRKKEWVRITHWANKAKKGKKTVWMLNGFVEPYLKAIGEEELNRPTGEGVRKFSAAQYIKKQLKGFFDIAVFDEMHLYKSGSSAQGSAMHALCRVSKHQLGLTGTIAGGFASDLFYTLFRLDPRRMKSMGYNWGGDTKFTEKYGTIEYQSKDRIDEDALRGKSFRGRITGAGRKKPGISPLIFIDFLLDRTVFLDISDMSKYIPELKETVVTVPGISEVNKEYNRVIDILKNQKSGLGMAILSTMLQFSLSYLDKPYGAETIVDPFTGAEIVKPESFFEYKDPGTLLPKEEAMLDILNRELDEGRNVFVYAEYTASEATCITERLREIIIKNTSLSDKEVVVLNSNSPEATRREEWIREKAIGGARVIITNPKCVETGLDFCFEKDGCFYNYPTIIFYQIGYSLQTVWQAAHRHLRLNQRVECRTYYMAYENTVQQAVIGIIAKKMTATAAIQGKFSGEGLAAMAEGVDTKVLLAKALADKDMGGLKDDLQAMFDCKAASAGDTRFDDVRRMKLFSELTGITSSTSEKTPSPVIKVLKLNPVKPVENEIPAPVEKVVVHKISVKATTMSLEAAAASVSDGDDLLSIFGVSTSSSSNSKKTSGEKTRKKKASVVDLWDQMGSFLDM